MMGGLVLAVVGLTSLGAYLFGRKGVGFSGQRVKVAVGKMLETVGFMLLFIVVNLAIATGLVLVGRAVTRTFFSVYNTTDESLLVLSLLQGLTFHWWRELSTKKPRETQAGDERS